MTHKTERVFGIDLARGTAAFLMVVVHSLWMYGNDQVQYDSIFGSLVHTLGQATSAFLLTMGFSLIVTHHQSLGYIVKRAILVLIAGYVLNALKFVVPISVFGTMPESFLNAYGWSHPINHSQLTYLLLTGDILQMAGISFLIAGCVRHFIHNKWTLIALSLAFIGLYAQLKGYRPGIQGIDYICDLLWGDQWNVYFPVLPWITNIFIGMFIGMYYKEHQSNESMMYRAVLYVGIPAFITGLLLCLYDWEYHFGDFFHAGPGGTILSVGGSLCFFYVFSKVITRPLQPYRWFRTSMLYLSTRVTSIYMIQWVVICWGMGIVGYHTLDIAALLKITPLMIALTLSIDYGLLQLTRFITNRTAIKSNLATTAKVQT